MQYCSMCDLDYKGMTLTLYLFSFEYATGSRTRIETALAELLWFYVHD